MKQRRISRACDYCHQRSIRCKKSEDDPQQRCHNCIDFDQPCTFARTARRRGAKLKTAVPISVPTALIPRDITSRVASPQGDDEVVDRWHAPHVAKHSVVVDLVDIYFEVVYPIFPFFHQPSFSRKIARADYQDQCDLFLVTMAMCALTSARIQEKALFNPSWDISELTKIDSKIFYRAVQDQIPHDDIPAQSLNLMRTYALLSLTAIQYGHTRNLLAYLGRYHTLVEMDGLHDEANWPENLGVIELEERRRLFWSMYTLDVFSAIVWWDVSSIRVHEQQYSVQYPTELDDTLIVDSGYRGDTNPLTRNGTENTPCSWLKGWNITTDLWRILEHATLKIKANRTSMRSVLDQIAGSGDPVSAMVMHNHLDELYHNLPECFKRTSEITCDPASDRYGFQSANISATIQLLKMVLLASESNSIEERCRVVSQVVDAFMHVPIEYLRAISSPLLHHLAAIGSVLRGVLSEPLDEYQYHEVRTVLLSLAQLLENLHDGPQSESVAQKLRTLVHQIDVQMTPRLHETPNSDGTFSPMLTATIPSTHTASQAEAHARDGSTIQISADFLLDWPWKSSFVDLATF